MSDTFDKELGVWMTETETVDIPAYQVDLTRKTAKQIHIPKKVEVQVMYTRPQEQQFSCAQGFHQWEVIDIHKYHVRCHNCPMHKILNPIKHKLVDGQVFDRNTGKFIF